MRIPGSSNLAAVLLAAVVGLMGGALAQQSLADPPSVGTSKFVAPLPGPTPPARAKPAPPPPPYKPFNNSANTPTGQSPPPVLPSYRASTSGCRAACATSCNNSTPCTDLSVTQCTSERQRCRLQCSSSC
jgi:hypothetical protein